MRGERFERVLARGVLAGPAGLLLVGIGLGVRPADRLAIRDLRRADIRLDAVLALQPVDDVLQVEFTHAVENGLPSLMIRTQAQAGVLARQLLRAERHLLHRVLGAW